METKRLILRRWRESDLAPFAAMNADPVVMEHYPACLTPEESEAFVTRADTKIAERGFGWWATAVKDGGEFIGYVGLNVPGFEAAFTPCVEIGWRLAHAHWGKGYATEAALACLDFGFGPLGLTEILSWTAVGNTPSRRVMERIGMVRDPSADFDHPTLPPGHRLSPHVLYRIARP